LALRPTTPSISVIIPALNERENLPHVLPKLPLGIDEIILVDGASTDGTVEMALQMMPSIKIVHQTGRGKGDALRCGFEAATGDIIVMLDADGSTDPNEIPRFVHALLAGADFAKGSRFLHGGGTSDMPFHRRWGNASFVRLVRMLFGGRYTDLCYGYNAMWRDVLPALELDGQGFEIETMMNIRVLRAGLKVVEVPSFEDRRVMGVGRLRTVPDGWRVLRTIWRERSRPIPVVSPGEPGEVVAIPIQREPVAIAMSSVLQQAREGNGNGHPRGGNAYPAAAGNGHSVAEMSDPVWETLSEPPSGATSALRETWAALTDTYVQRLQEVLARVDREAIARVVEILRTARDREATVFLGGNGGSAATASHWTNDLGKATKLSGRQPLRVMNLSDNVPWLTALANDEGYDRTFAGQLENFARPDDVLMIISASGNSPNILRALEMAASRQMVTIGLLGFDGGMARELVAEALWVETELGAYGLVETAHAALADIITACLIADRSPAEVTSA
jgi:phosphoheptose isomerase